MDPSRTVSGVPFDPHPEAPAHAGAPDDAPVGDDRRGLVRGWIVLPGLCLLMAALWYAALMYPTTSPRYFEALSPAELLGVSPVADFSNRR